MRDRHPDEAGRTVIFDHQNNHCPLCENDNDRFDFIKVLN